MHPLAIECLNRIIVDCVSVATVHVDGEKAEHAPAPKRSNCENAKPKITENKFEIAFVSLSLKCSCITHYLNIIFSIIILGNCLSSISNCKIMLAGRISVPLYVSNMSKGLQSDNFSYNSKRLLKENAIGF